jgi:cellulose synthase/poly-beta-1,6-N-acetylglucosamine synthase-like glycosyltransferase
VQLILITFYILLIAYIAIVIYFIIGWLRTKNFEPTFEFERYPTLSILIPVRNEEEHIANLLKDIQAQSYPTEYIDVIVIDDESSDGTVSVIKQLNFPNVRVIPLKLEKNIYAYKKSAITLGVQHSAAELIVTTDGDCRVSKHWIASIVAYYLKNDVQLISAPVSYFSENNWFEKIQTIEFQYLIGASAACISNGMPNTCNGANMIYTRSLFHEIKGYEGIDDKASGDDEMLLHKVYKKDPKLIGFLKSTLALVLTYAKSDFKGFIQQRIRWASNGSEYTDVRTTGMLVIIFLVNLALLISVFSLVFTDVLKEYLYQAFLIKVFFDGLFIYQTLKFFGRLTLFPYMIFVLVLYTPYIVIIGLLGSFSKSYNWKGRIVK